ncbi:hypothetical protein KBZ10_16905 [Streptomyces sp. F63]|uniref:hypothetical protein n=1 Tax=Streptomyces sp. F63 TaxID=2824887 RepID=UPI001B392618|nr:hypothetical protein [Streptomyces sp. F63]MBQ0986164.1 hypothetical protein [Streptomyces sp. F63]
MPLPAAAFPGSYAGIEEFAATARIAGIWPRRTSSGPGCAPDRRPAGVLPDRAGYRSSLPGLCFTGLLPAAFSYGPVTRFVRGTAWASPRPAKAVAADCW